MSQCKFSREEKKNKETASESGPDLLGKLTQTKNQHHPKWHSYPGRVLRRRPGRTPQLHTRGIHVRHHHRDRTRVAPAGPHVPSPAQPDRCRMGSRRQAVSTPSHFFPSPSLSVHTQRKHWANHTRLLQPALLRRPPLRERHHPSQRDLGPGDPRAPGRGHDPRVGRHQPGQELHRLRGPQRRHAAQDHLAAADGHGEPVVAEAGFAGGTDWRGRETSCAAVMRNR